MSAPWRRAGRIIATMAGLALLGWLASRLDWHAAARSLRDASPRPLAAALLANLLSLALKGVRWWVFLRPAGVRSLPLVLRATAAGAALNNLVVAQGGEGARIMMVARGAGVPAAPVAAALGIERLLDGACYLALLAGSAWFIPLPPSLARWRGAAGAVLVVVAVMLALLSHRQRISGRSRGLSIVSPGRIGIGALLSIAAWSLQVACYHLVAGAAHLALPVTASVAAVLAVGLSFLVRATPGNVGIFQVVYAVALRPFGVAEAPAVATALLLQTVQVFPVLALGAVAVPGILSARRGASPGARGGAPDR